MTAYYRARLTREQQTSSPGWWNIIEVAGGWKGIILATARNPENAKYNGKSLAQIATMMRQDPADAAFDLVAHGKDRVMAIYFMMSEPDIETALRFPWTSIGSDARAAERVGAGDVLRLPHPRAFGNSVRVIAKFVKERGTLALENAIRKMIFWLATRIGCA